MENKNKGLTLTQINYETSELEYSRTIMIGLWKQD